VTNKTVLLYALFFTLLKKYAPSLTGEKIPISILYKKHYFGTR